MHQQRFSQLFSLALAGVLIGTGLAAVRAEETKPPAKPAAAAAPGTKAAKPGTQPAKPGAKAAAKGQANGKAGANARGQARRKAIEALNLTADQKEKLKKLRAENRKRRGEIQSSTTLTADQKKEQLKTARDEQQKKFLSLLTADQKKKWETVRPGARKKGGAAKADKKADAKK